ncbi:restriction endonuclease subunit S [Leptolyngbya sp. NIES-2104]|uniref:restriction endonuclease subunit S n=1 Tax=Leptolyngbya sp. NIES-2104 TaxID=1552121 RepID=UPI0006EC9461|nr:restriction endonuclease subunit S [Leptolyngbya sp. NIES-2104]GAQ00106.1 type I restriction-modification system, specificity subunit S [Leptolyngbya sp. NIES-2104]
MSEWSVKTIGELCDLGNGKVQTGPFGSQLHQSDYQAEGYPFVMPKDIVNGKIDESSIARVSISHVERLSKHKLSLGDIIYGRRGDIGRQALVRQENIGWLCGSGCLRISLGDAPIDSRFLHLYLKLPEVMAWVENQAIGATMPNLNTKILRSVPVRYPANVNQQQQIVAIVSAYDDSIENNDRRIALLEKMAEEIYREWFVRLRFPGHEQVTFHKGIPEGWQIKQLQEVAQVNAKSITKSKEFKTINYVDIASVTTNRINHVEEIDFNSAPGRARRIVKHGDVIWSTVRPANRAYCLILNPPDNLIVSTGFAVVSPKKNIPYSFLHQAVTSNAFVERIANVAKGSAYPAASREDFEKAEIIIPVKELLATFHALCAPMLKQKDFLIRRNEKLKQTRDRLLTRLISGKLSVEDLDIQFPPSTIDLQ